ncbi:hypothetical protein [Leptolyngbya sp. FACHB-261]|uniref:hypothetical protein n=1 Tax=Leptolyngbya sp. FACHB-261 TaxID=2692806 RepID=UPI0016859BA1|nr:hypothetical protein [Leptolyngbya sp. FACHB-261]MBD2100846.1 hypothetical protein [Leptolyngbya sp. FACHB-261]
MINLTDLNLKKPALRFVLIGPRQAVQDNRLILRQLGYAELHEWSPPQAIANHPDQVISILIRAIAS